MPTLRSNRPNIAVTIGDPAGMGPEVSLKALASPGVSGLANFLIIGDAFVLQKTAKKYGLRIGSPILDLSNVSQAEFAFGRASSSFGRSSIEYIDKAIELIKAKKVQGLVTAPVNKASIRLSGLRNFKGHTEYLAKKSGAKDIAMMFFFL